MVTKRTFTKVDLYNLLDDVDPVEMKPWRHGTKNTYVFKADDDHHYRVTIDVHTDEGWQLLDSHDCTRVVPEQRTVTVWVPA